MKLIMPLFFFLFFNITFSQDYREATIIFNDNTSIKGFAEIKNNEIYFKLEQEDKPDKWSYDIAKGIIFSGYGFSEKFEYLKYGKHSKPKIFEVIEEGNINLYRESRMYYTSKSNITAEKLPTNFSIYEFTTETFYVKKKSEEFATDISFSFKTTSKKYFSDCEKIIKQINNGKFTRKNIPDMVFYYNEYCDENNE
ncbi:hypothetical protein [Flavobacterium sp. WC2509]|uniref:hypothetical protein n=1 Tax=Flavobacterium sp. WC2509 TaxID=3461406 RepID=UPI0040447492